MSSNYDYTSVFTRPIADGKFVIGFGERKAPASFLNSCSKFLYFDEDQPDEKSIRHQKPLTRSPAGQYKLLVTYLDNLNWLMMVCKSTASFANALLVCKVSEAEAVDS